MKVNRETEALEAMGINPLSYIVFPRILGGIVSVVCLAFYFILVALIGGYIVSYFFHDLSFTFYTDTLGMRLVKRSVNQDDVSAYHLFYADAVGSPGTDLTFFDWSVPPETRGTHSIVRTALRVRGEASLAWWLDSVWK